MSCKLSRNLEPNFVVDDGNMGLYNTTLQVDKEYTNKWLSEIACLFFAIHYCEKGSAT